MVEGKIISIGDIGYVLGICSKKLSRWYKHILSGYNESKSNGELRKNDYRPRGRSHSIRVPIVAMEHYGTHIAIDEKHIRGRYHTIISNGSTGKIILMVRSTKSGELYAIVRQHFTSEQMMGVKVVTKDGAQAYDWLSRQAFPNAAKVLDKFHVLKWVFDALQQVRIQLKNEYIIAEHEKEQNLKQEYQIALKKAKLTGEKVSKADFKLRPEVLANGETFKELLHRSRYLLYKYEDQWNEEQEKRAQCLFDKYPKFESIYIQVLNFRIWYSKDNIGKDPNLLLLKLLDWVEDIRQFKMPVLRALATTIKSKSGQIVNYFITGKTNAPAEALNRNIKRFIGVNYGIRELDYFYYRLNILNS